MNPCPVLPATGPASTSIFLVAAVAVFLGALVVVAVR